MRRSSGADPDEAARRLARPAVAAGDATGWFEPLYAAADEGAATVPWDRGGPHPLLLDWTQARGPMGRGLRAMVVGCGLGDDAELVAGLGFNTVAFDVAPTAIEAARRRFPDSPVHYLAADLLDPPAEWHHAFDLVVESLTVQSLPDPPRSEAITRVTDLVGPGGTLLVIAAIHNVDEPPPAPPWPLTRAEIDGFATGGVVPVRIEEIGGRWRAEFRRPG